MPWTEGSFSTSVDCRPLGVWLGETCASLRRNGSFVEDTLKDRVRVGADLRAAAGEEQPVPKHAGDEAFDVVGDRVGTAVDERHRLDAAEQRDGAARADAEF